MDWLSHVSYLRIKGAKNLNILMLYASAGGGHKKAAEVVKSYLLTQNPNHTVRLVDTLKEVNQLADVFCCDGYQLAAKYAPWVFGTFYKAADQETPIANLVPAITARLSRKLLPLIEEFQPDVIISTYHFSAQMVSHLKGTGQIQTPLVCIVTDYGPHRAWISPYVDAYVVSDEGMAGQLVARGVSRENIYPFGIPVEQKFFQEENKEQLLSHLGFRPNIPTLLFMAGSFGVRSMLDIYQKIDALPLPFQCIVITGKNPKLYRQIENIRLYSPHRTKLVYFTSHVEKYMHAADLLLTKPGGLTISEALASGLPMAVFGAIPGQEEDNERFLRSHQMGISICPDTCRPILSRLLGNPQQIEKMRNACKAFDKSDCAKNICKLIHQLADPT